MNLERITFEPNKMSGKACVRGLRISAATILRCFATGMTTKEVLDAYPYLEAADISQVFEYSARLVEEKP